MVPVVVKVFVGGTEDNCAKCLRTCFDAVWILRMISCFWSDNVLIMGCAHSALHRFSNVTVTFNSNTWSLTDAALTVASIFDCRLCGLCKLEALSRDTVDGFHHLALLVISVSATPYY
ncbi:unnamed protein product, partial [Ascophyllum nodosum]